MTPPRCSEATRRARSSRASRNAKLLVAAHEPELDNPPSNPGAPLSRSWKRIFLNALGQSSDLDAACAAARISVARAHSVRREDPEFAIAWRGALLEGYENLELETLFRSAHRQRAARPDQVRRGQCDSSGQGPCRNRRARAGNPRRRRRSGGARFDRPQARSDARTGSGKRRVA